MASSRSQVPFEAVKSAVAGSATYASGGRFGPRRQRDFELLLLDAGEMRVTIDGAPQQVKAGQAILLKPGHVESFDITGNDVTRHNWVAVQIDKRSLPGEDAGEPPDVWPVSPEMNKLVELILTVQNELPSDGAIMRSLGAAVLRLQPDADGMAAEGTDASPASPAVERALAWIRSHYGKEIKLSDLAWEAGVTPEHLVRLFNKYEQETPIHYVWRYRSERAVELLEHTGLPAAEIARQCGFKTPHHFSRTLKQITGRTPSEIRRASWNGEEL
ncbi:AraC-like ligand binding domain-containing protein [Cohnella sp. OV330]|uniref:AraC family transcriptional regulator n=1 Tax=Cohnella sp. OV330 TaxID=1855288 RepID=UPI0008ED5605|nr:AraC family transcriptional regulator [Cohnella sp. OV330]SFB33121.1 AraC-like ligand binding domain-containing protein [Cohnella sp. OV330]